MFFCFCLFVVVVVVAAAVVVWGGGGRRGEERWVGGEACVAKLLNNGTALGR